MDVTQTFRPIAELLIDDVFATPIVYRRVSQALDSYDPATGTVTKLTTDYAINAGVLSSGRTEQGGAREDRELRLQGCQCSRRRVIGSPTCRRSGR
jgi:hypothetical protein